jgi:lipoprotein-anchoring transpeptidase ErfK/SrfK
MTTAMSRFCMLRMYVDRSTWQNSSGPSRSRTSRLPYVKIHLVLFAVIAAILGPAVSGAALPPVLVPADVHISGVDVSGMRPDLAQKLIYRRFYRPVRFVYGNRTWEVSTALLSGGASFRGAVDRAVQSTAGTRLQLRVVMDRDSIDEYVDRLADQLDIAPVDAKDAGLLNLRPVVTTARYGRAVQRDLLVDRIFHNVATGRRVPIQITTEVLAPAKLAKDFGRVQIVIRRLSNKLYLYKGTRLWRVFGVATGQSAYPTPTGTFTIVDMQRWPWWYPPASPWAIGAHPIPPGPGNPLGTRWMGLSVSGVGMHGTPDDASIGYSESHGCIRMHIPDAEWLFDHVTLGTRVTIADA